MDINIVTENFEKNDLRKLSKKEGNFTKTR